MREGEWLPIPLFPLLSKSSNTFTSENPECKKLENLANTLSREFKIVKNKEQKFPIWT